MESTKPERGVYRTSTSTSRSVVAAVEPRRASRATHSFNEEGAFSVNAIGGALNRKSGEGPKATRIAAIDGDRYVLESWLSTVGM
jgi:hypothetical protein